MFSTGTHCKWLLHQLQSCDATKVIKFCYEIDIIVSFDTDYQKSDINKETKNIEPQRTNLVSSSILSALDRVCLTGFRTASPLAQLYSTSTMEHHHFDQCIMILSTKVKAC